MNNTTNDTTNSDDQLIANISSFIPEELRYEFSSIDQISKNLRKKFTGTILYLQNNEFSTIQGLNTLSISTKQEMIISYFKGISDLISFYGGSSYNISGFSLLISFNHHPDDPYEQHILRVIKCTLEIIQHINNLNRGSKQAISANTQSKYCCSLVYGEYNRIIIGSELSGFHAILFGKSVNDALTAVNINKNSGNIIVSANIREQLSEGFIFTEKDDYYILRNKPEISDIPRCTNEQAHQLNDPEYQRLLKKLINPLLLDYLENDKLSKVNKFCEITCLGIKLSFINNQQQNNYDFETINNFYEYLQAETSAYNAYMITDYLHENDQYCLILFGTIQPQIYKELKALEFGIKLTEKMLQFFSDENPMQMCIATGLVYTGEFGGSRRKIFTAIGSPINQSLEILRQNLVGAIFADEITRNRCEKSYNFEIIQANTDNNQKQPSNIYKYNLCSLDNKNYNQKLFGRENELSRLNEIYEIAYKGNNLVCSIVGAAGFGKSNIIDYFCNNYLKPDSESLISKCYPHEQATPFYPWRSLLKQILKIDNKNNQMENLEHITKFFTKYLPDDVEWSSFFAKLLGMQITEDEIIKNLDSRQRQFKTFEIITSIFNQLTINKNYIIIFEDIQWIDDFSVMLFEHLEFELRKHSILFILTSRSDDKIAKFKALANFYRIELSPISDQLVKQLIHNRLNLDKPNRDLEEMIFISSGRNPYIINTMIQNLIEQKKIVENKNGTFTLSDKVNNISIGSLLYTAALKDIDLPSGDWTELLKSTAVIENILGLNLLENKNLDEMTEEQLLHAISTLEKFDSTEKNYEYNKNFIFDEVFIRDIVFQNLINKTKEQLHLLLAVYLEKNAEHTADTISEKLAYHFQLGNQKDKALYYYMTSGDKALAQNANREAINHYQTAQSMINSTTMLVDTLQIIKINKNLAVAYKQIGNYEQAENIYNELLHSNLPELDPAELHFLIGNVLQEKGENYRAIKELETSLKLLKIHVPASNFTIYFFLAAELLELILQKINPLKHIKLDSHTTDIYERQMQTLSILNKIYIFDVIEKIAWSAFAMYNVAKKLNKNDHLSIASSDFAMALIGMGLPGISYRYFSKGVKYAEKNIRVQNQAIAYSRLGFYYLFNNNLKDAISTLNHSIELYKKIGEIWEMQSALGALGQAYFLGANYSKSIDVYNELGNYSTICKSPQHQAWTICKTNFMKYLTGTIDAQEAIDYITKGIKISQEVNDQMNLCIMWGHLAAIALREGDYDSSARYAEEIMLANEKYRVIIPHVKISYVNASLAAIFAIVNNSTVLPVKKLKNIALRSMEISIKIGKQYDYLKGPSLMAKAKYLYHIEKDNNGAKFFIQNAIEASEKTANNWEKGIIYKEAAMMIPEKKEEYAARAKAIFHENNLVREEEKILLIFNI